MRTPSFLSRRLVLAALLASGMPAMAQDLKSTLPIDPQVVKGTLPNGLTYYIRPNKKPDNKVELRLAVKAGSILEDPDQLGLAHFMEHMNFNGLQHFEKNELVNYLQSIGVEFGADLNAYTGFDETVYILPIPTDNPGNLEKGFQIIEDWAHNALLTDKDINEERNVVLEESRMGKGAEDRMMKLYLPKYVSGSLYADRLPIGKDDILKGFKPDVIRRYYKDWYRPDLQAVMVVGDIDTATALKMIREHFGGLQNPPTSRKRDYIKATARTKAEAMVVSDKEAITANLQILFPLIEKKEDVTLADYRESIKRNLALSIVNRRLRELAQSPKPPFPYAAVGFEGWMHGAESFTASTVFSKDGVERPLNALTAELIRARDFGFTASELERAKAEVMAAMGKMYNERKTTASQQYIDEYVRNFLTGEAMPGLDNEFNYHKELVPGISLAEVSALPKTWMSTATTFSLITAPQKAELKLPTDAALLAMTQKGFAQKVSAPVEAAAITSILSKEPVPGKLSGQQEEEGLGATTYTFSNGVKVTLKTTDFKSDEILLTGTKKGGMSLYNAADKSSAQYAVPAAAAMGFGTLNPTQIEQAMSGKVATVKMSIGELEYTVEGGSSVKDFESMLQLLNLRMTSPRKDEELFDAFRMKQKQQLQFLGASPQVAFLDTAFKVLYKKNPLAPSPVPRASDFDALKLDRSQAIYKEGFGNAAGYHFYLVGNVQPDVALPLLEKYVASLPATGAAPAFKDNGVRPIDGVHKLDFKKGTEKQSLIISLFQGNAAYTEDFSMRTQAVAEVLNIKVIETLREKLGGIYSGGFQAEVDRDPYPHYQLVMYLPCGPENVDKLITAANEEIEKLKATPIDAKELDKVKNQWREKYRVEVKENRFWADKLESVLSWNKDKQHVLQYEKWIDGLTPAEVQQTAKTLFDGKNQFTAVLNPES
jgi:zinc protease